MPVTQIKSRWSSGNLIFHDVRRLDDAGNILKLTPTGVVIGDSSNEFITKGLAVRGGSNLTVGIEVREGSGRLFHANPSGPGSVDYCFHANVPANIAMEAPFYVNNYRANLPHAYKISDHAGLINALYMHEGTVTNFLHINSPVTVTSCIIRDNSGSAIYLLDLKGNPARTSASCGNVASDGAIKMRISGVIYFIPIFNVANTTGSW